MFMFRQTQITAALALAGVLSSSPAFATEVHAGDILPMLDGSTVVIDDLGGTLPVDLATGALIYEANFGDLPGGLFATDDPGYDHEAGQFAPGTLMALMAVDTLKFWDGSAWTSDTPAVVTIADTLSPDRPNLVINSTLVPTNAALLGEIDSEGNFHVHADMSITNGAAVGAYLVTLKLVALQAAALDFDDLSLNLSLTAYTESDPFMIIFNRGLDEAAFEASVDARIEPQVVPVPAAALLFGSGLFSLSFARRMRGRGATAGG